MNDFVWMSRLTSYKESIFKVQWKFSIDKKASNAIHTILERKMLGILGTSIFSILTTNMTPH